MNSLAQRVEYLRAKAARNSVRISDFQARVYAALMAVPRGKVTTYALLGGAVGCRSPRAIGQAMRTNPFAPEVPCHRVIASDLGIGGFQGRTSGPALARKIRLLRREGVRFADGKLVDARLVC